MSRHPVLAIASIAVSACAMFATLAGAYEPRTWRLLARSDAFPPTFETPLGVYDPARQRVLVVDVGWNAWQVRVHAFEPGPNPRWSVLDASGTPPVRPYLATVVLDPLRDRLLVLGTELVANPAGLGVWALTLSGAPHWTKLTTVGAPGWRTGHSAIYEPVRDRVLVFGGMDHHWVGIPYLSDVWELSLASNEWSERIPLGNPPGGREGHGALYDPVRRRMLVFAGHFESGVRGFWNDLWELSLGDTLTWAELPTEGPRPGARSAFATTYDPLRRRMLVHGGVNEQSGVEPDDLWALALDGAPAWARIETEDTLRGRSYPVDAFDPIEDRLLACGGSGYPQVSALALAAPVRWEAVVPTRPLLTPGMRKSHAVVHDLRRDRFLAIGGNYSSADSSEWEFEPDSIAPWHVVRAPQAPGVYSFELVNATVYDSLGDRLIVFDGRQAWAASAHPPGPWERLGPVAPGAWSGVGHGAGVAIDARRNRLLVTGGWVPYPHGAGYSLPGICALSLGPAPEWSLVGSLPHTSAGHAAFCEPATDRLVILGGFEIYDRPMSRKFFGPVTWSAPLASFESWTEHRSAGGPGPPAPPTAYATFDPKVGSLFVAADSSVWTRGALDGGEWAALPTSGARPVVASAVAYDVVRDQLLALFAATPGSADVQAWAIALGPMAVSLLEANRTSRAATLRWKSISAYGREAFVERRDEPGDWKRMGTLSFEPSGLALFTDTSIEPGHDYTYRVTVLDGSAEWHSDLAFVPDLTALSFALKGARPSPGIGSLRLWFILPDAAPALLEIFDVGGRQRFSREVGTLGPGVHTLVIQDSETWRPGEYFARLRRGGESRTARVALVR